MSDYLLCDETLAPVRVVPAGPGHCIAIQDLHRATIGLGIADPAVDRRVHDLCHPLAPPRVPGGDAFILVATTESGEVVACIWGERWIYYTNRKPASLKPSFTFPHIAHVSALCVAGPYTRQGIGRALMTAAVAVLQLRPDDEMTLEVRADNTPARALYKSLGMELGATVDPSYYAEDATLGSKRKRAESKRMVSYVATIGHLSLPRGRARLE